MFKVIKYATLALAAEAINIKQDEKIQAVYEAYVSDYAMTYTVTDTVTVQPWQLTNCVSNCQKNMNWYKNNDFCNCICKQPSTWVGECVRYEVPLDEPMKNAICMAFTGDKDSCNQKFLK